MRVRSLRAYELVRSLYLGRGRAAPRREGRRSRRSRRNALRRGGLDAVRRRVLYGAPRPADEELMLELRRRFRPEVVALGDYLGSRPR